MSGGTTTVLDDLLTFLRRYYNEDLQALTMADDKTFAVDWQDLHQFDPKLAETTLTNPVEFLENLDEALAQYDTVNAESLDDVTTGLVNLDDAHEHLVGGFSPAEARGTYRSVTGQVTKVTETSPNPTVIAFECQRCGTVTRIPQSSDDYQEPHECQGCERQGPFRENWDNSEIEDYQRIKLQEPPEEAAGGGGATLEAVVRGDLVEAVTAGDRATLSGVIRMVKNDSGGGNVTFDVYMEVEYVAVEDSDFQDLSISPDERERIDAIAAGEEGDPVDVLADSLLPGVRGYETIKEALVLQLCSGVRAVKSTGDIKRGVSHVLLVGDPGTAKSTMLSRVAELSPRSTYASGKGASKAGLTAAAVADDFGDTKWSLDAGALVVASDGVACVDEIDKVPDEVVSSMHDALSTTKVRINKAGINTTLQARTSLLAAGNPTYGRFDQYEPIFEQIDLGPTLISRFDLIFVLTDEPDEQEDPKTARHIIRDKEIAKKATADDGVLSEAERERFQPDIEGDIFRKYVAQAREIDPRIRDDDVREALEQRFVALRAANGYEGDDPVPVTWRKLEGTHRLAEASARARHSETIEMLDVERAQRLIGDSMQQVGVDENEQLDADVVETGTSKSQKERMYDIDEILRELQDESDDGRVPMDDLLAVTDEHGYADRDVEHTIEKLKKQGEVIEKTNGDLRSV